MGPGLGWAQLVPVPDLGTCPLSAFAGPWFYFFFFIEQGLSKKGGSRNEGLGPRGPLGFEGRASCFPSSLRAKGKETGWKNKERG